MIYLRLFWEFFKIGLFTFGGGYAMIPLVKDAVINFNWLSEAEFYDLIGICESTPGPIAVNMATYVGSTQGGILGSALATLGVVLPSFIIIVLVVTVLNRLTDNKYFKSFITGVKPVITALILSTGFVMLIKCIGYASVTEFSFNAVSAICFVLLVAIYNISSRLLKKKPSTITMIIISAALGILLSVLLG